MFCSKTQAPRPAWPGFKPTFWQHQNSSPMHWTARPWHSMFLISKHETVIMVFYGTKLMMELNFPKNYSVGGAVILRIVEVEYHIRMSNEYNILGCHGRAAKCIGRVLIDRVSSVQFSFNLFPLNHFKWQNITVHNIWRHTNYSYAWKDTDQTLTGQHTVHFIS